MEIEEMLNKKITGKTIATPLSDAYIELVKRDAKEPRHPRNKTCKCECEICSILKEWG